MKVLVVHQQVELHQQFRTQFSSWYVRSAYTGLDGLLAARIETFDLVLCCVQLPVVTGIEMVRSIRNFSLNQKTPVIILADGHETEQHERLFSILNANLLTLEEVQEMNNLGTNF